MIYTGIGARKTPCDILIAMTQVGEYMAKAGHTLRSGGAQGADRAFEIGCDYKSIGKKVIYLPIKGWQKHNSCFHDVCHQAMVLASKFHPKWDALPTFSKLLMGRNSYQILGFDLDTPTDFVVCWTPKGEVVGGTGQALRMAKAFKIPIINFGSGSLSEINEKLMDILGET